MTNGNSGNGAADAVPESASAPIASAPNAIALRELSPKQSSLNIGHPLL
jgi:hypothetical protein